MANRRLERLNELLKREISRILRREVRDPRVGSPTVTGVEVSADLWSAKVHVRLTGEEEERTEALEGLEAAAPFVRKHLGDLRIRRVPELQFLEDRTLDYARRIEQILDEVAPSDEEAASEDGTDAEDGADARHDTGVEDGAGAESGAGPAEDPGPEENPGLEEDPVPEEEADGPGVGGKE